LRGRYAIDVDSLDADPEAVREALERRECTLAVVVEERQRAQHEQQTAQLLLCDTDRAEDQQDPDHADVSRERGEEHYDSAEGRRGRAAGWEGVADDEAVEVRVVADRNQGCPAHEAVVEGPQRTPTARRTRGQEAMVRSTARRTDRGR